MPLTSRSWFRGLAATSAAVVFAVAGGSAAMADLLEDDVIGGASVDLVVGGATGSAQFWVNPTGSCDITAAGGDLVVNVVTSNAAVASVSPEQLSFSACNQKQAVTITPVAVGSAEVTLTPNTEPANGRFTYATASVPVQVTAAPARTTTTTTVTCPASVTYDGSAQTPCTATVTGSGGFSEPLTVDYTGNTNAGTATASAAYAGSDTREPSSDTETFVIGQADAVCTVTGYTGTFDGAAHAVSATCTGLGGVDLSSGFDPGQSFTNAGEHTATWTFEGGLNYADQTGTATVSIAKAPTATLVTCPESVVYDGSAREPCTAEVTGAGGLKAPVAVSYSDNIDTGTATASATYAGGDNYLPSDDAAQFEITKATTATVVTCPAGPFVYTGSPITPACSASTTGAGGLSASPTVSFTANTNAGTATASAEYPGDANHAGSTGSTTFTIEKAPSTVTLICTSPVTYTGGALEPCSAKVTGAGGLDEAVTVSYVDNTDAGTATASASYAGDANHEKSSAETTFTILRAASVTTVTCPASVSWTGSPITPCTAEVTGAGMSPKPLTVVYTDNTDTGTATASASWSGDANHDGSSASTTFTIAARWTLKGFSSPVDMSGVFNSVKGGSTVPLKFEVFAGSTELTTTSAVESFVQSKIGCDGSAPVDDLEFSTTGGTSLRYDSTGGRFIQNWQTPKAPGTCYKVTMTTQDGSFLTAFFKLR